MQYVLIWLERAKWLIEQGDFKDLDHYIDCLTPAEKRRMRREETVKKKRAEARKKKRIEKAKQNKVV